ncbi:angiopoietin-related protein 5-like isoform X2 [Boleophthalmus pectinirostris]|uniref:angiopoietin-related protein 5-like isoform X2 n=1 Tax=Boleophthalmus pectinirostris TaxID=150288 RepID=UPI000A1C6D07|nr:angiopoietin-related protein 5-like isoform X2 [Boleophthalmus pectinirostris]
MRRKVGYCGLILVILFTYSEQSKQNVAQGTDCSDIKGKNPQAFSGVYWIQPNGVRAPFKVYCEMRADGSWTVFQKRSGPQMKFNRVWAAYKNGFGSHTKDHWLGLRKIFALTKDKTKKWTLRVDLWDHEGNTAFAEYTHFKLGNEKSGFKLHVRKFNGTAGDAIRGVYKGIDQNGFGFSTIDKDNDGCQPCIFGDIALEECAASEGGGWWFSRCGSASLHGDYHPAGDHIGWASGLHWDSWKTSAPYSLKATRMMVKPVV